MPPKSVPPFTRWEGHRHIFPGHEPSRGLFAIVRSLVITGKMSQSRRMEVAARLLRSSFDMTAWQCRVQLGDASGGDLRIAYVEQFQVGEPVQVLESCVGNVGPLEVNGVKTN